MIIRIKNLDLRTIIGVNDWEQKEKQDIRINIEIEYDGRKAVESDDIEETVDYKKIKKRIIQMVENSRFQLLDALVGRMLEMIMENPKISRATVEIDKPHALRFAESVSISSTAVRS